MYCQTVCESVVIVGEYDTIERDVRINYNINHGLPVKRGEGLSTSCKKSEVTWQRIDNYSNESDIVKRVRMILIVFTTK